jgi:exodeoxyribonuclease-5
VPEFSEDQREAMELINAFIEAPFVNRQYFTLFGLAGTGKTFLLARLTERYPGLTLTAFTGKAASVLRTRVACKVTTLHSVIYDFKGLVDDEFDENKKNPIFTPKGDPLPGYVILVDECSMLGARIAQDLLDTGARVVACGDPGQLPPVRDRQFFTTGDYTLHEVHRQAWDSPIVRQAHNVRSSGRYEAGADERFRVISFAEPAELLGHDVILCWRNRTRQWLNARKRSLLQLDPRKLAAGEPIMCLKNDHRLGVYNGAVYSVVALEDETLYLTDDSGNPICVPRATIEGFDLGFEANRYDDEFLPFAVCYASTVHKSQGSEYGSVLLFDEYVGEGWRSFTYTGITRAINRCTVVRWRST